MRKLTPASVRSPGPPLFSGSPERPDDPGTARSVGAATSVNVLPEGADAAVEVSSVQHGLPCCLRTAAAHRPGLNGTGACKELPVRDCWLY